MIEPKIASVYAEALFELSCETDCLEDVSLDLISIIEVFESNPEFLSLLSLPNLDKDEKLDAFKKVFEDDGSILFDFMCLLTERDRIAYISEIGKEFKKLYNKHNDIEEVTITTCVPLSEDERKRLIVKLQNKLSKRIKLIENIDQEIIGGVKLCYGDTLIDNSIASRIESLSKELKNNNN